MPRGIRLSDDERQRIIELLPSGRSCRSIAHEVEHSPTTVARIAHEVGHVFGRANIVRAQEARLAYGAEWRADFAKRLSAKCDALLGNMEGEYLVFNFGGRDNDYREHVLDSPPTEAKLKLMQAIRLASQTVLDIDRHDSDGGMGLPAVDEWLQTVRGTKA
jgi:transposase-like protein